MTEEIEEVRKETRAALRRGAYFWGVMVLTMILSAGSSMLVSVKLGEQRDRKLCAVVITSDDAYRQTPPSTQVGKVQARNFSRLRHELGCDTP